MPVATFDASYSPLSPDRPGWGEVACLPWDEAIFGFPVAEFRVGAEPPHRAEALPFRAALNEFAKRTQTELVSVRFPVSNMAWMDVFCQAGFIPVDLAQDASFNRPRLDSIPRPRFGVRRAGPEDSADVCRIAGSAFRFGRYHTDPRFPPELANRRYVKWVQSALESGDPKDHVFVLGSAGQRLGFFHAVLRDGAADLRLAAADPNSQVGLGLALYAETLSALYDNGARRFSTKVSAANMGVINLYASLGFRFSNPEHILHWHAPGAPHLL